MRKRVGVFGGSFAPVHDGHIGVAVGVIRAGIVDEVWFLPCRRNPLKKDVAIPDKERIALLEEAVERAVLKEDLQGKIKVDPIELGMPEPSYTYHTMEALLGMYPEFDFRLVIGADSYLDFKKWVRSGWLAENFRPVVFPRPGYELDDVDPPFTLLADVPLYDISSTRIRALRDTKC